MSYFIIDCATTDYKRSSKTGIKVPSGVKAIIKALDGLSSTIFVENGGVYHEDESCSQILLETTWNEAQLEKWLYEGNWSYLGVVEKESQKPPERDTAYHILSTRPRLKM